VAKKFPLGEKKFRGGWQVPLPVRAGQGGFQFATSDNGANGIRRDGIKGDIGREIRLVSAIRSRNMS